MMIQRLGSEIPQHADRERPFRLGQDFGPRPFPEDCLPFSNGRAALAWMMGQVKYSAVLMCAYSCPKLVLFFKGHGLKVGYFDAFASGTDMAVERARLPSPCLTLLPALFGVMPKEKFKSDNSELPLNNPARADLILIDAMQTAFAHFEVTDRWVLSGPRKTTGLPDGAILRYPGGRHFRRQIMELPPATEARAWKMLAQRVWTEQSDEVASALNACAEQHWPKSPHRMSDDSLDRLERLDVAWHVMTRQVNAARLLELLSIPKSEISNPDCVPFGLPILVNDPKALQDKLKRSRIYATRLFHDCDSLHTKARYLRAHLFAKHLLLLPVDQRCDREAIVRIADAVRSAGNEDEKCQLLQHVGV